MSSREDWVVGLICDVTRCDKPSAVLLVERLKEEGVLNLAYGNNEVDRIVAKFTDTFGTTRTSKYDRFAAHRLSQKYSAQAVCGIIDLLAQKQDERFVPVVASISDLEKKWVNVLHFLRNNQGSETLEI